MYSKGHACGASIPIEGSAIITTVFIDHSSLLHEKRSVIQFVRYSHVEDLFLNAEIFAVLTDTCRVWYTRRM